MTTTHTPQQKLALVNQLASQRMTQQALKLVSELTKEHPEFTDGWFANAFLLFQNNQVKQAIDALKQARKLDPENINYAFQEIMMFNKLNRPEIALKKAQKLVKKKLPSPQIIEQLARLFELNNDFINALNLYEQLSAQFPNQAIWLLKQAAIFRNLGEIENANEFCNQALQLTPNDADGHFLRSHLKKQNTSSNHIAQLQELSKTHYPRTTEQAKILFSLAKELEDCKRYEESFAVRKKGADMYRQSFQYDVQSDIDFMRQVQLDYNADFINQNTSGCDTSEPIFIVGLPRSGTTLLDRIISSHTEISTAGELKQLNQCVLHALQSLKLNPQLSRTEIVTASLQLDFKTLGKSYLQTSRTITGNSPRFTDKFPQNSYYVGMILKALPNAKIIIMQRHPVAVCYALYKQMFTDGTYPYSYDFHELATYYKQHNELLKHWQKIGGDAVKTVYYEDLVNDLESQSKDILGFLNLPWQPQCLDFHKNKQPTATASASQVREKLYTSSIDLWRQYEQHLQPLINNLDLGDSV